MAAHVRRCALWALAALAGIVTPAAAALAQEARISFRVFPFVSTSQTPLVTVALGESKLSRNVSLPSLTFATTEHGSQLTGFAMALPVLGVGKLTFSPRFGDQRVNLDYFASSLSGMSLGARTMRGLSMTTTARASSWTLMLGQAATTSADLIGSSLPKALAFTGTIKPRKGIAVAPRMIARLGRQQPGATSTSIGTGMRLDTGSHLALIGDIGLARNDARAWAHLATAGAIGQWSRTGVEASVRRGDRTFTLLGAVPFAAEDREFVAGKLLLFRGVSVSGQSGSSRPAGVHNTDAGTVTTSVTLTVDRIPRGQLVIVQGDPTRQGRRARIEWRHRSKNNLVIRYVRRDETATGASQPPSHGRLEVDLLAAPRYGQRFTTDLRALMVVAPHERVPLLASRMSARFVVRKGIGVGSDAELTMFRTNGANVLRTLRVTSEAPLLRDTSLQLFYAHQGGVALPFGRRFEARVTRVVRFSRGPG